MSKKTIRQVINDTLREEMRRDPRVILMGEDVIGGTGGTGKLDSWGGAFGITRGLVAEFGTERVRDTPISEAAFVGAAAGAALTGLRPVVELMFSDFLGVAFDQVYNQIAKFRYMFGGKAKTPVVIRMMYGAGSRTASQHSQTPYALVTHIPGLKVVVPSCASDAKGLLTQAIRDDDPVLFFEHKKMYDIEDEVPDGSYTIPFAEAKVTREGKDATIVAVGRMVLLANQVSDLLRGEGIACGVVDPRTLSPLDTDTILECVADSGRLIVVDEANPRCSFATDIAALAAAEAFDSLRAPVKMVTAPHTPVPYAPNLEDAYVPSVERILAAVRQSLAHK